MAQQTEPSLIILVVDDAKDPLQFAFEESARVARSVGGARIHVLYLARRRETIHDLELVAASLSQETNARALALGVADRFEAVHVREGDPVSEVASVAQQVGAMLVVVSGRLRRLVRKRAIDALHAETGCPVVIAMPPRTFVPDIAPACPSCIAVRERTGNREMWCAVHDHKHLQAHTYGYRRVHPLTMHDSNVIPTGISFG